MKTHRTFRLGLLNRCRGVVAVEMGLILPFIAIILMATFYLGRVYWQYNVIKNVSASAARYVAQGSWTEIVNGTRTSDAEAMVKRTLADAGLRNTVAVKFACPPRLDCSGPTPASAVSVQIDISGNDPNPWFPIGTVWTVTTVGYSN